MFENLKAVCEYKTLCKVANRLPTYQCTYGDNIATHRCSEEKCPFMKQINEPITRARIRKPKAEFVKVKLEHNELPDEVIYNVFDETNKYLSELVHTVNIKVNAHTDGRIMKAVQTIVGNHFIDDISIDKDKVIEAFSKYHKKKIEPIDRGRVRCPVCGCHQLRRYQEYCGDCGQHLDWEVK